MNGLIIYVRGCAQTLEAACRWNGYTTFLTTGAGSWGEDNDSCGSPGSYLYSNGGELFVRPLTHTTISIPGDMPCCSRLSMAALNPALSHATFTGHEQPEHLGSFLTHPACDWIDVPLMSNAANSASLGSLLCRSPVSCMSVRRHGQLFRD